MTVRGEKWETHRAADQDAVRDLAETLDDGDLVAHFRAAEHRYQGPRRVLEQVREDLHLALEQQPGGVVADGVRDALSRSMSAVSGAEGVVDVDVRELSQPPGQLGIVLRLARLV